MVPAESRPASTDRLLQSLQFPRVNTDNLGLALVLPRPQEARNLRTFPFSKVGLPERRRVRSDHRQRAQEKKANAAKYAPTFQPPEAPSWWGLPAPPLRSTASTFLDPKGRHQWGFTGSAPFLCACRAGGYGVVGMRALVVSTYSLEGTRLCLTNPEMGADSDRDPVYCSASCGDLRILYSSDRTWLAHRAGEGKNQARS